MADLQMAPIARSQSNSAIPANLSSQATNRGIIIPQAGHTFASASEQISANIFPIPNSITISVASATGAGAAATRVGLFNQDIFGTVSNNGSGAGSITYTYQDGTTTGALVSAILTQARAAVGTICYGVATRMLVTSSKAGDATGLANANGAFYAYNAFGASIPLNLNMSSDQGRQDYDSSIEVIPLVQNISRFVQYSFVLPVGDTATLTFYFTPNFRR